MANFQRIIDSRHPIWLTDFTDWEKWRLTYAGGGIFRETYLVKFDNRESNDDFGARKRLTPVPAYAKSAINDVRNAIFQRLTDVIRSGGSENYQKSVAGENGGVDRRGSTMNYFLGNQPLTDLLVMGQVGVYVDMPTVYGSTIADAAGKKPYLYYYQTEDILNWAHSCHDDPSEFSSIVLRDTVMEFDQLHWLPVRTVNRYRHMWISPETGLVSVQFYNEDGEEVDQDGNPSGPVELQLTKIPFVMLSIGDSLLKDVADHQIALMNLCSSDVNYALKSNFPFYTEQRDLRNTGGHLKRVASDGTASTGGQGANDETIKVGVTQGRYYDLNAERPQFIAPPSDPLVASLRLQEKLEQDIRKLINLAVINLGSRTSGASKDKDSEGLEAGLSYIGLVLEGAERKIANYWAAYEERVESRRKVALVRYPDTYSLKTNADRIQEAAQLNSLMFAVPGQTVKKEIAKNITKVLFGGRISVDTLNQIHDEIDEAEYTTSDPKVIIEAKNAGLVGEQTASMALGFSEDEYLDAREDHVERIRRITETQSQAQLAAQIAQAQAAAQLGLPGAGAPGAPGAPLVSGSPAARGIPDLDDEPVRSASEEKVISRETDTEDTTTPRVRGEGNA